jgi:hypothetical protein
VERRLVGVLLLAATLLAVVVFAGLRPPRRVAGSPQSQPPPGPPTVGDCVPDPVNLDSWVISEYEYPQLRFERCDGLRFGEVVAVLTNPARRPATGASDTSGPHGDPNPDTCGAKGLTYVGGDTPSLYWSPRVYAFAVPISPSRRQQAAGQHWVACAMFRPNDDQTAVKRYDGSLRMALATGNARNLLGFCGAGRDWTTGYVSVCSTPHEFQVLASGTAGAGDLSRAELQRTCVQVARRLTALPDVTAAGALAVKVQSIEGTGASTETAGVQAPAKLGCGISTGGSRRLAGGLVGIGDLPIPWAD